MKVSVRTGTSVVAKLSGSQKGAVSVGIQGPSGTARGIRMRDIADVDLSALADGDVLVYDATQQKWIAQLNLDKQNIDVNGGGF